jgi:uncharacterized protein (DUF305 family)
MRSSPGVGVQVHRYPNAGGANGTDGRTAPAAYDQAVPFWRFRSLLLVLAAGASLASCNGGVSVSHAPNATDAVFLRSMTDHERATLGIPRLAQRRALRAELRGIARTMTTERDADLRELGSLARGVDTRRARPPAPPSSALSDLSRVKDATSFDHEFMRTMIEENQRAIAIAHNEVRFGSDPAARRLAGAIEASRRRELARLNGWLHLWYGGGVQPGVPAPGPPGGGGGQTPQPGPNAPSPGEKVPL